MVYWSCLVTYNVFFFFKTLDLSSTQGGFCLPIIIFSVFGSVTDVCVPQVFFFFSACCFLGLLKLVFRGKLI